MNISQRPSSGFSDDLTIAGTDLTTPVGKAAMNLHMSINEYVNQHMWLLGRINGLQRELTTAITMLKQPMPLYASGVVQSTGTDIDKVCASQQVLGNQMDVLCAIIGLDRPQMWEHIEARLSFAIAEREERTNGKGK